MDNPEWKNYPFDADSKYQKQRNRWKHLIQFVSGSGHILNNKIYQIDQKFNHWEKTDVTVWDYKPIRQFNQRLQRVLDTALNELNELEQDIDDEINTTITRLKGENENE